MLNRYTLPKKRTIVLFIFSGAVSAFVAGCGTLAPRTAELAPCPPTRTLICEEFGPETRCQCSDPAGMDRELDRLGLNAAAWPRTW